MPVCVSNPRKVRAEGVRHSVFAEFQARIVSGDFQCGLHSEQKRGPLCRPLALLAESPERDGCTLITTLAGDRGLK